MDLLVQNSGHFICEGGLSEPTEPPPSATGLFYDTCDGHNLSNTVHCECLKVDVVLAIEREVVLNITNKMERFIYKGEWVNGKQHI